MENTENEKQAENGGAEPRRNTTGYAMNVLHEVAKFAGNFGMRVDPAHDITVGLNRDGMVRVSFTLSLEDTNI